MTRISLRAMIGTSVVFLCGGACRAVRRACAFLLFVAALIALGSHTVEAQTWARSYGGNMYDDAKSIARTSDGGFVIAGSTVSFGAYGSNVWVLKLTGDGNVLWQKTYGGNLEDYASSVVSTSDGGFVVTGFTASVGNQHYEGVGDFWVLKLDSVGGVQWQWAYGGPNQEHATSIVQTSDGGFAVAGWHDDSYGLDTANFWVLRLDGTGGILWQREYSGNQEDVAYSIVQTSDGGFAVAGHTRSFGMGGADAWILRLSGPGDIIWQKTYGGSGDDHARSIVQTSNGGFAVAGYTSSFGAGGFDVWVLSLDSTGEPVWSITYGGDSNEVALAISVTTDGGYVVTGYREPADVLVLKLDNSGGTQWVKGYGGGGDDTGNAILQTPDGGYVVAGQTSSFGAGGADAWILKLNSSGDIGGSCTISPPGGGVSVGTSTATVQTQCEEP